MAVNLTANAIAAIDAGDVNAKPLVQVLDIKLVGSTQERYRLLLSDSAFTQHAMIATQLNHLVKLGTVRKGSVVQLIDYISSFVQNRKIIVILNLQTIIPECEKIGNPIIIGALDSKSSENAASAAAENPGGSSSVSNPGGGSSSVSNPGGGSSSVSNPGGGFRPSIQPPYQPPSKYKNAGAVMKNEAPARIIPIAALNPYQGRWAIKGRVTAKGDLRRYNNAKGDGKVFSFDLLDSEGGEIRVTCFNAVVDRFYDKIEVGKVYVVSKGSLKQAQKNYNHLKNEWEILLDMSSSVDLCPDEDTSIPTQNYSFKPISYIEDAENNSVLDIIGVVIKVNPSVPIVKKNGMETQRRVLIMKDQSGCSVELTMWGEFCNREGQKLQEMVEDGSSPVLVVKAGKVNDFAGKSMSTLSSTQLLIDPDIPEAQSLNDWFNRGGKDVVPQAISKEMTPGGNKNEVRKTVCQIKDEGLGRSGKTHWISVKATISFMKTDSFCYTACPLMNGDRPCSKKVNKSGDSRWQCDRCNQEFEECDYRYLLQAQIQDHTGLTWVTAFQESGQEILGCSAKELYLLKHDEENELRFSEIIKDALFKDFLFRLKVKEETYGDEQRVKITVVKAEKLDYAAESRYLLGLISDSRSNRKI